MGETVKAPCSLQNFGAFYGMDVLLCIAHPYRGGGKTRKCVLQQRARKANFSRVHEGIEFHGTT